MTLQLPLTLQAQDQPDFKATLKQELESLSADELPLQQALRYSSRLAPRPFSVMLLHQHNDYTSIHLRIGVFYTGIIAGCSCADDPAPQDEVNEYCELAVVIDRATATATIVLLEE
ncbi:MAG: hypothetical protein HUJ29_05150 [Gammaproteobacteria bacterium]|nr:hypothetical protein [Gammaproteobacteria bacterium]